MRRQTTHPCPAGLALFEVLATIFIVALLAAVSIGVLLALGETLATGSVDSRPRRQATRIARRIAGEVRFSSLEERGGGPVCGLEGDPCPDHADRGKRGAGGDGHRRAIWFRRVHRYRPASDGSGEAIPVWSPLITYTYLPDPPGGPGGIIVREEDRDGDGRIDRDPSAGERITLGRSESDRGSIRHCCFVIEGEGGDRRVVITMEILPPSSPGADPEEGRLEQVIPVRPLN